MNYLWITEIWELRRVWPAPPAQSPLAEGWWAAPPAGCTFWCISPRGEWWVWSVWWSDRNVMVQHWFADRRVPDWPVHHWSDWWRPVVTIGQTRAEQREPPSGVQSTVTTTDHPPIVGRPLGETRTLTDHNQSYSVPPILRSIYRSHWDTSTLLFIPALHSECLFAAYCPPFV